jgi:hypothetical protein
MIVTILIWYITTMTELTFLGLMSVYPTVGLYGHTEHDFILYVKKPTNAHILYIL